MSYKTTISGKKTTVTFPKPKYAIQTFVPSLYENQRWPNGGGTNWYNKGTQAERSRQYGVIFELTPGGELWVKDCNAPEALSHESRIVTRDMWFVYEYEPKGFEIQMQFCSMDSKPTGDGAVNIFKYSKTSGEGDNQVTEYCAGGSTAPDGYRDRTAIFTDSLLVDAYIESNKSSIKKIWYRTRSKYGNDQGTWGSWSLYYDNTNTSNNEEIISVAYGAVESFSPDDIHIGENIDSAQKWLPMTKLSISDPNWTEWIETNIFGGKVEQITNNSGEKLNWEVARSSNFDELNELTNFGIAVEGDNSIKKWEQDDSSGWKVTSTVIKCVDELVEYYGDLINKLEDSDEGLTTEFKDHKTKVEATLDTILYDTRIKKDAIIVAYYSCDPDEISSADETTPDTTIEYKLVYLTPKKAIEKGISEVQVAQTMTYGMIDIQTDASWNIYDASTYSYLSKPSGESPDVTEVIRSVESNYEKWVTKELTHNRTNAQKCLGADGGLFYYGQIYHKFEAYNSGEKQLIGINLDRWNPKSNNIDRVLSTNEVLAKIYNAIKNSTETFKWTEFFNYYDNSWPPGPINIRFANGIFTTQDIHVNNNKLDSDGNIKSIAIHGWMHIDISGILPLSGSHDPSGIIKYAADFPLTIVLSDTGCYLSNVNENTNFPRPNDGKRVITSKDTLIQRLGETT